MGRGCKKKLNQPTKINDIIYAEAVIKHFFGISVNSEEELIKYWHCYKKFKIEEGSGLQKALKSN
jgi:capsule polysaccharide export protein KpsE/RkpR